MDREHFKATLTGMDITTIESLISAAAISRNLHEKMTYNLKKLMIDLLDEHRRRYKDGSLTKGRHTLNIVEVIEDVQNEYEVNCD